MPLSEPSFIWLRGRTVSPSSPSGKAGQGQGWGQASQPHEPPLRARAEAWLDPRPAGSIMASTGWDRRVVVGGGKGRKLKGGARSRPLAQWPFACFPHHLLPSISFSRLLSVQSLGLVLFGWLVVAAAAVLRDAGILDANFFGRIYAACVGLHVTNAWSNSRGTRSIDRHSALTDRPAGVRSYSKLEACMTAFCSTGLDVPTCVRVSHGGLAQKQRSVSARFIILFVAHMLRVACCLVIAWVC